MFGITTVLGVITGNAFPADASRNSVKQLVFNPMCVAKIVRERESGKG